VASLDEAGEDLAFGCLTVGARSIVLQDAPPDGPSITARGGRGGQSSLGRALHPAMLLIHPG